MSAVWGVQHSVYSFALEVLMLMQELLTVVGMDVLDLKARLNCCLLSRLFCLGSTTCLWATHLAYGAAQLLLPDLHEASCLWIITSSVTSGLDVLLNGEVRSLSSRTARRMPTWVVLPGFDHYNSTKAIPVIINWSWSPRYHVGHNQSHANLSLQRANHEANSGLVWSSLVNLRLFSKSRRHVQNLIWKSTQAKMHKKVVKFFSWSQTWKWSEVTSRHRCFQ